jgi:hypothetical protein
VVGERADPQLAIYAQGGVDLQPVLALSPAQPTVVGESLFCNGVVKVNLFFIPHFEPIFIYIGEFIFFFWRRPLCFCLFFISPWYLPRFWCFFVLIATVVHVSNSGFPRLQFCELDETNKFSRKLKKIFFVEVLTNRNSKIVKRLTKRKI